MASEQHTARNRVIWRSGDLVIFGLKASSWKHHPMTRSSDSPMISSMSTPPLPACPKCGRRIAAWKMDHCVYCGAPFPSELKEGVPEPEALKWVERPQITPEAARQLEMMKVVRLDGKKPARSAGAVLTVLSIPVFGVIFYLLYALVARSSPGSALLVLLAGAIFIGYLLWVALRPGRG
jgi:hypothetical protein